MVSGRRAGQPFAGRLDQPGERAPVERPALAALDDVDAAFGLLRGLLLRPRLRPLLAVQHVRAGDVVLARAHQRELDLVLDVLYMEGAALRLAAHERADRRLGERADELADARRGRALAPFTARNALVMATLILAGSKPTTAPLRRMTLYSEYGLRAGAALLRQRRRPMRGLPWRCPERSACSLSFGRSSLGPSRRVLRFY